MQSKKMLLLKGLAELDKLETSSAHPTYKYVVPNCEIRVGRKPMVMQTKKLVPTAIIRATTHYVAICQLLDGETAPDYLPRVTWAYL